MARPRLLDLFCGAGGASVGYHRAGFEVVGVDIAPQPRYPFEFVRMDAFDYLTALRQMPLHRFAAVHASPPCQRWAQAGVSRQTDERHPDWLTPIRAVLPELNVPFVIENIPTAPGPWDVTLCGTSFGLPIVRHRVFRCSFPVGLVPQMCHQTRFGRATQHPGTYPYAHGAWRPAWRERVLPLVWPWMELVEEEAGEAIPPAYTQFLGEQLMAHLAVAA